jgi:hypothetical protein
VDSSQTHTCYCRLLSGLGVNRLVRATLFHAMHGFEMEHSTGISIPYTDCPIGQGLETGCLFPVGFIHFVWTHHVTSQPSAASWWLASRLTAPFRGMLLTETKRLILLSPNGSSGACTPNGDYSHSIGALHGAPRPPTTMATLTPHIGIGGFGTCCHVRTSTLLDIPYRASHVHDDGLNRIM